MRADLLADLTPAAGMASRTDVVNGSGDEGSQPTLPAPPRVAGPGLKLRTEDEVVFAELLEEAIDSLPRKIKGEAFFRAPVFLGCLSRMRMADAHLVLAQLAPPMDEEMEELVAYAWPSALVSEPLVRRLLDVLHRHHEGYSSDDSDGCPRPPALPLYPHTSRGDLAWLRAFLSGRRTRGTLNARHDTEKQDREENRAHPSRGL